jgi:hypothetical protein
MGMLRRTPHRRRSLRSPLLDASLLVLAGLLAWGAVQHYAAERRALRDYPSELVVRSEITFKADLVEELSRPPQLIFIGGSRCERFDPSYAARRTGLRAFNLAFTNSHPEGAWALANWLHDRRPEARLRWVWGVNSATFSDRDLDPALLQDQRFSWYFDDALLHAQRTLLPQTADQMPQGSRLDKRRYERNGLMLWNTYDRYLEIGGTLDKSLDRYIATTVAKVKNAGGGGDGKSRSRVYFEKTLQLLNEHGTTPVIVAMPIHPRVLAALRPYGRERSHARFLAYLHGLEKRYRLRVVDLTELSSFGGDPDGFYDGVHITRENSDRVIDALVEQAGDVLR